MISVAFTYNGSDTLTAVCTGLTPFTAFHLVVNDPDSAISSGTSDGSGNLTIAVGPASGIGGLSAGDTVFVLLRDTTFSANPSACGIIKYGTSGAADQGLAATWAYDGGGGGAGVVTCTFPTVGGITYVLEVNDDPSTVSVVGDGTSKTLTYSVLNYAAETAFNALLFKDASSPEIDYAIRLFEAGVAGTGSNGQQAAPPAVTGRVLIAFGDGPLVASPTWTRIDGGDSPFPQNFVSGYDVTSGRQTLLSQTDTGTATVYINDHVSGLFDPRNVSSPYFGLLDGRQILLQLYDPVAAAWEDQFRGHIDEVGYDIDGSAVDSDGAPINASIQLDCVDLFAFLADYGLTPGLDGVSPQAVPSGMAGGSPPVGGEDGVWYATTTGTNDDRLIEILADVGIPVTMYGSPSFASGNTHAAAVKYDPDESALQALRDAADADMPFIANIFCDRHGKFQFHGRGARFYPDAVAAEPGSDWDFTRWAVGDGAAIEADPTRAQMRILQYGRGRRDVINVATCYPQDLKAADMPSQIFADTASITAYGKHSAPPMSDLLLNPEETQPVTGFTGKNECFHYAKLLVLNQKDPREAVTALQLKAIQPTDPRAAATWTLITRADISHIVNVAVGYPGGTGFTGASPEDDYYIEGRKLRVRPLNPAHDYVELDLEVSPAVWSMDTHGVFPDFSPGPTETPTVLTADFTTLGIS